MADKPVAYRRAKCCAHCAAYKGWMLWPPGRGILPTCRRKHHRRVAQTDYCSRFRWAAQYRPPTPEKPATVGEEVSCE